MGWHALCFLQNCVWTKGPRAHLGDVKVTQLSTVGRAVSETTGQETKPRARPAFHPDGPAPFHPAGRSRASKGDARPAPHLWTFVRPPSQRRSQNKPGTWKGSAASETSCQVTAEGRSGLRGTSFHLLGSLAPGCGRQPVNCPPCLQPLAAACAALMLALSSALCPPHSVLSTLIPALRD